MSALTIEVQKREKAGKGVARAIRREGNVPAIIYGGNNKEIMVSVNSKQLVQELHKPGFFARVINFKIGNDTVQVLPKTVQFHPVSDKPEHADFIRVSKDTKVKALVKADFKNAEKSPGLKRGGILNIVRREIEILCFVDKIPSIIEVDLTGLSIGDSIHIEDLILPEGVEPSIKDRNFTVATIVGRLTEEQEMAKDAARTQAIVDAQAAQAAADAAAAGGDAAKPDAKAAKPDAKAAAKPEAAPAAGAAKKEPAKK